MYVTINTLSTNAVRKESVDGRSFTVLTAMMIRSNTSMNGIFYPHDELKASFSQMEDVPAPFRHPKVSGQHVSASNNFAKSHDIGAFVKNVTMKGKEVFGEIWIDEEFASRCADGINLLKRIANKSKIAISTGLTISRILSEKGVDELGKAFNSVGRLFSFDHVAILEEGETAAGGHAGTEIIFNSQTGESLFVTNHSGGQPDFKPEENLMEIKIDASDLSKAERVKLQSMTANELILAVNAEKPAVTIDEAKAIIEKEGLTVNTADSVVLTKEAHTELKTNAEKFTTAETARIEKIKEGIIANSKFEGPDLENMAEAQLQKLADSLVPDNDFSAQGAISTNSNSGDVAVDYS